MRYLVRLKSQVSYLLGGLLVLSGSISSPVTANSVSQVTPLTQISNQCLGPATLLLPLSQSHKLPQPVAGKSNGRIAFAYRENGSQKIYVMNPDGSNRTRLTDGHWDSWPAWSPDGSMIAFKRKVNKDSATDLYVMTADGNNQKLLARNIEFQDSPAWSPDGSKIAFASWRERDQSCSSCWSSIHLINSDGSNEVRLTQPRFYRSPTWSPDGKKIAFVDTASIYVIDSDGGNQTQLPKAAPKPYFPSSVSWSPDGSEILIWGFESFRNGSGLAKTRATIRAISAPEAERKGRLIGHGVDPVWSPDGSKVAFARSGQIYVMDADGKNQIRLTNGTHVGDDIQPAWEPRSLSVYGPIRNTN